jgi:hypothetical protein
MLKYLDDLLILIGCALILVGTYQVCPVATWFVGGVMAIGAGVVLSVAGAGATEDKRDHKTVS